MKFERCLDSESKFHAAHAHVYTVSYLSVSSSPRQHYLSQLLLFVQKTLLPLIGTCNKK